MRKFVASVVAMIAIMALPQLLLAQQDGGKPDRARPDAPATRHVPKFQKTADAKPDGKHEGHHRQAKLDGVKPGEKKPHGFAKSLFDRLDTNHDGVLSFDEFAAGLKQLRHMFAMQECRQMPGKPEGKHDAHFAGHRPEGPGFAAGRPWEPQGREVAHHHAWRSEGRVIVETETWRREYREYGDGRPWQSEERKYAEGHPMSPRHVLASMTAPCRDSGKAAAHHDFKKPECKKAAAKAIDVKKADAKVIVIKKPEGKKAETKVIVIKKPEAKNASTTCSLEARVASLEKQQAEMLSLLHKLVHSSPKDGSHAKR